MKKLILVLSGFITVLVFVQIAHATAVPKVTWCHTEPSGNQQTLELPQQALEQAGHVDANGNPLHAGDHAGACIEPSPTTEPTVSPTIEVTPTVVVSPTAGASASPSPTDSPTGGAGDGLSDHKSDGLSSCPECTKAPEPTLIPNVGWK